MRYVGGPLDGAELDVTGWDEEAVRSGTYEVVDGWADRADYEPEPGGDRWCGRTAGPWPGSRTARRPHTGGPFGRAGPHAVSPPVRRWAVSMARLTRDWSRPRRRPAAD